uniref:NAD-dependent epimerase/dehydratase domain-containing protein n=1 Tax=Picea sitchensis TaxID=3332 RepID=A9P1E4_PICSI|nr:unknown [Picea sitchensis]
MEGYLEENGYGASDSRRLMCVTGGWSFLGIHIARMLLGRGYSVRFAIPVTPEEAGSLVESEEALSGKLEICQADLLDYRSVFGNINGCSGVFHVPAPCDHLDGLQEYPTDSVDYEVQSALNVVEACAGAESVKRLVFTSSVSAIVCGRRIGNLGDGEIMDEKCWTNLEFCREKKLWSPLAKTLSNPNSHTILNQLKGSKALQQNGMCAYVEVEEAALAHVAAFECENARGRYICLQRVFTEDEIKQVIWSSHMTSNYRPEDLLHPEKPLNVSNEKFLKLKRQYSGELA